MSQETDESEPASWWDTGRGWKAFVFAPLAALPVVTLQFGSAGGGGAIVFLFPFILELAYVGALLLGAPLYFLLRAFKLSAFWIAPAAGAAIGFAVMVPFLLGIGFKDPGLASEALKYGTPSGAAVGAVFWLIARPDRPGAPGGDVVLPDWAAAKAPVALLIAPFAVPIGALIVARFIPEMAFSPWLVYPVALVVSISLFRILREVGLTGLWTSAVAGCAVGLAAFLVSELVTTGSPGALGDQSGLLALLVFALSGASLGTIFWLIARPDRHVAARSDDDGG